LVDAPARDEAAFVATRAASTAQSVRVRVTIG
jgi:hypothetical protein